MLLCITPNLCIERTMTLPDFAVGAVHRVPPEQLRINVGGKGINVARVAHQLGAETLSTGWVGRRQRVWLDEELASENLRHDFVEVEADTRVCVNILDGRGTKTEIVEAGQPLAIHDGTQLLDKVNKNLPAAKLVALSGSYPPTDDASNIFDTHATLLVRLARQHRKKMIYDGKGRAFAMALRNGTPPWCIAPNVDEAQELLKRQIKDETAERRAIAEMLRWGVEVVLLTCGARGAWLGTKANMVFLAAPQIHEVSPVGSGDSFIGAFAAKYLENDGLVETDRLVEATRWGIGAGAANAMQALSAQCKREEIEALLPQVNVRRIQQMLPMMR